MPGNVRLTTLSNSEIVAAFERSLVRRGLVPKSVRHRSFALHSLARHLGGPLLRATRDDIEAWLDTRGGQPQHPRTRAWYLSQVRCFYSWCVLEEFLDIDPTVRIPRPKLRRTLPRPIASADFVVALSLADKRMRCWLLLGGYQGLRAQEMAGLRGEDIIRDDQGSWLRVSAAKGGYERVLPLHPEVLDALVAYGLPSHGPVFRGRDGAIKPSSVSKAFSRFMAGVNVGGASHQLRHWFGTTFYRATKDLRMTQEVMGHASPNSTQIYTQVMPSEAVVYIEGLSVT